MLWANLHLLFWLSLFPFATAWMGENHFATTPTAFYGVVLLCAAIAYFVLQTVIVARQGPDSALARALGRDWKGKVSPLLYFAAIGLASSVVGSRWGSTSASRSCGSCRTVVSNGFRRDPNTQLLTMRRWAGSAGRASLVRGARGQVWGP